MLFSWSLGAVTGKALWVINTLHFLGQNVLLFFGQNQKEFELRHRQCFKRVNLMTVDCSYFYRTEKKRQKDQKRAITLEKAIY